MAEKLTILSVPCDSAEHAERFGAQHDVASGTWFVVGPVHRELQNYIPQPKNPPFQESAPCCPKCGARTHKLKKPTGDVYWACVARFKTRCRGVVDYLDYLDAVVPLTTVSDFLPTVVGSLFGPAEMPLLSREKRQHPLMERWIEIAQKLMDVLGDKKQALLWMEFPKVALGNKAPILVLGTVTGCDAVRTLVDDVWK